ncbi:Hsp20/alpha crystallin family protein [Metabacillus halosaccharovorans]|uniref:Hsp20/alpha crystallin family protein n=1 Tax=Metabacillus halosaccharovorans TaxID=930124 RepID=UPI001C1FC975|nr:Hsp20/alpha crystallin family protein [Metabacillus halosaccharovorans]MBU7592311.1 Hsp20/alpha crystallin family protein [Metabacillus halosaccharovorans]
MNKKKCSNPMDIQGIEEWMSQFFTDPFTSLLDEQTFRLDLFETGEEFIVEAELGETISTDEINITVNKEQLYISILDGNQVERERRRTVVLPFSIEKKKITACYTNGILEIKISKSTPSHLSSRHITING